MQKPIASALLAALGPSCRPPRSSGLLDTTMSSSAFKVGLSPTPTA